MKFILKICINAVTCHLLLLCCLFALKSVVVSGIPGTTVYSACTLVLLYIVNIGFNKIVFLKLSMNKNLLNIKLGILILGLYFLGRELLIEHASKYGILAGISRLWAIDCLIMLILSIPLDIILKKLKVEF